MRKLEPESSRISWTGTYLDCSGPNGALIITYQRSIEDHLGLHMRERELRDRLRSSLKKLGRVTRPPSEYYVILIHSVESMSGFSAFMEALEARIDMIARRPFTSRNVEEILSISARERLRWTKDGRLLPSGSETFRRGQKVTTTNYAVKTISHLAENPHIIDDWREQDGHNGKQAGTSMSFRPVADG